MLRHTGHKRNFKHDLRLAILLCLNAGFINAAGFLAFSVLTTNVTGHAALLAVDISSVHLRSARMVALWLLLFLAGAFCSSLYIIIARRDRVIAYSVPLTVITLIVFLVACFGHNYDHSLPQTEYFAGSLLFAMGMQNALVSVISGSMVRTTHLTGMFTDLGIDLSAAFMTYKNVPPAIKQRIILRTTIISFFLIGGVIGGICFSVYSFHAFYVPVGILLSALFYDYFRIKITRALHHTHAK